MHVFGPWEEAGVLGVLGEKPAQTQGERANSTRKVTGSLCNFNIPSAVVPSL